MADSFMANVPSNFDMNNFVQALRDTYMAKGFSVNAMGMGNTARIVFDKGCGGINMLLGLGKGITANCMFQNGMLIINYTDADWTSKIVGLCVGWFLCLIPFITSIVGCINQSGLTKEINNDITMILGQFGGYGGYGYGGQNYTQGNN